MTLSFTIFRGDAKNKHVQRCGEQLDLYFLIVEKT